MTACFITALLAAERASSSVRGEARPQAGVQGNSNSRHQHHKGPPTLTGCLTFASLAFLQKYPQLAPELKQDLTLECRASPTASIIIIKDY